jgi:hypothetical protein
MIRKHLKYLFSAVSGIFFLFAGTGYNIIEYCCDECAHHGIEYLTEHSCSAVHHHNEGMGCCTHNEQTDQHHHFKMLELSGEKVLCTEGSSCKVERISLNDYTPSTSLQIQPHFHYISAFIQSVLILNNADILTSHISFKPDPPGYLAFFCSGREVLSKNAVLLI